MSATPGRAPSVEATSLTLEVFSSPTRPIGGKDSARTFSPITSTLISGAHSAVLVDAQFLTEDVDALIEFVVSRGKQLTTIFVTHSHGDHYYGADRLVERFPEASIVTTQSIVDDIVAHHASEMTTFRAMFGDQVVLPTSVPTALDDDRIELEGHELRVIEVGQGDIAPSAVLHVPSLDAVVAGDVAYNGIHQMLGLSDPDGWRRWIESVDAIEALSPRIVVAGHKRPDLRDDEPKRILDETRQYIRDFAELVAQTKGPQFVVSEMLSKYPDHGNVTTLMFSAKAAARS